MKARLLLGASLMLALTGCVSSSKPLRNAEGQVMNCKASGFGWLGAPVALISQGECLKKLRKQGYYGFDEQPGEVEVPTSAIRYDSAVRLELPDGWATQQLTADLRGKGIRIYALNSTIDAGVMVATIKRSAISDFSTYAQTKRRGVLSVGANPVVTDLKLSEEAGKAIAEYEASTTIGVNRLRYAYKIVQGGSEIAVITVWSSEPNFEAVRGELHKLIATVSGV